ncbi:MAG: hypothetical protein HY709_08935 [Candidatus Latescibacteria bacterium]|nr:hypothetical protein [Candidatus Latescibacterota bacterium]
MPIIRLKNTTADQGWRALITTGEPVHRIPPVNERRYVVSQTQLTRLRELQLAFDILEDEEATVGAPTRS